MYEEEEIPCAQLIYGYDIFTLTVHIKMTNKIYILYLLDANMHKRSTCKGWAQQQQFWGYFNLRNFSTRPW